MSIEAYLAVNLIADFALLGSVCRALGIFSGRRVLACAALCAGYAALAAVRPMPWASAPVQLAALMGIAALLTRRAAPGTGTVAALSLCAAALLCGGIARLAALSGPGAMPLCVASGAALTAAIFAARPPLSGSWNVRLRLSMDGRTARFPALIDTGNRLREPLSGLPVVIAEASLLKGILPEKGYRVLRFGGVGGEGCMACFRPSAVWIERGPRRVRGPEVWVAVSPESLPGLCQALAPPEFALYAKSLK